MESRKPNDFWEDIKQIISHAIIVALILLSIWAIHLLLENLLGRDAKLFDRIPIRYILDFADLLIIIRFLRSVYNTIWKPKEKK
jgi:hypothetical protein